MAFCVYVCVCCCGFSWIDADGHTQDNNIVSISYFFPSFVYFWSSMFPVFHFLLSLIFPNSFQFSYFYVVSQRSKDVLCEDSEFNLPGLTDRGVSTYFLSTLMFWLSVSACGHSHADSVWLFLNLCSWNFKMENWKKHRFLPVNEWTCIRFHRRKVYIFVVQQGLAQHQFNLAKN